MNILVTSLSLYLEGREEQDYILKKDNTEYRVSGSQTNEPVPKALSLYLRDKGQGLDRIIVVCTPATLMERADKKSDLSRFNDAIDAFFKKEKLPSPELISLCLEDLSDSEKIFATGMEIADIMSSADDPCVFVDSTGGFRDAMMLIISTMQLIKERSICISDVLYTVYDRNLPPPHRIISRKDAYSVYDLVSGMDELSAYGDPSKLIQYFRDREMPESSQRILEALKSVYTEMQLNRVEQSRDALIRLFELLDTYEPCSATFDRVVELARSKYSGFSGQLSSVEYIKWYYSHGYVSQTLSFYYEILPDILLENRIIYASGDIIQRYLKKSRTLVSGRGWNHYFINTFFKEVYNPGKLRARAAREELERLSNNDTANVSKTGSRLLTVISFILAAKNDRRLLTSPPVQYRMFLEEMQKNDIPFLATEEELLNIKNEKKFFNLLKSNESTVCLLYDIDQPEDIGSAEALSEIIVSSVDNENICMDPSVSRELLQKLLCKYFYLKSQRNSVLHVGNQSDAPEVLVKSLGEAIELLDRVLESRSQP
ncbi:MAG: hypothetical protein E7647_02795 [Ruminococcaceae bacterium]|nr:hypothetical protein [Oscillospiraceae bacterium]